MIISTMSSFFFSFATEVSYSLWVFLGKENIIKYFTFLINIYGS